MRYPIEYTDEEFVNQCEATSKAGLVLGEQTRLRLFRLSGHKEEPPNYMIAWPSVWEMISDARRGMQ